MIEKKPRKKRTLTEAHKEKIRATMLANKRNHTASTRKIMSEKKTAYWIRWRAAKEEAKV